MNKQPNPTLTAILMGGLIASTIDIGAASLIYHANPLGVMRAVASGVLGEHVRGSGLPGSTLGMVLQWLMGLIIAAIYVFVSGKLGILERLNRFWLASGIVYGVVIYFVMNDVVVPLSASPRPAVEPPFDPQLFAENMLAMILFGVIVAFFARRCLEEGRPARSEAGPA